MKSHFVRPLLVGAFFCGMTTQTFAQSKGQPAPPAKPPAATPANKPAAKPAPPGPAHSSATKPAAPTTPATPAKPNPQAAQKLGIKVTLTDGVRTIVRTRKELGFGLASSAPVRFSIDQAALKTALQRVAPTFAQEAVDARPYVVKGQVKIKPGAASRALDVPQTAGRITKEVNSSPATVKFVAVLVKKPPVLTPERLKGINGVLGTMTTRTSDNPKRNTNIKVAVSFIDGVLLSPGEQFSLNGIVGKRTQERGFRTAPVFVNAEKVPGIGGGVSQVTGTMFNAAAKAGLKVDEVNPHSRPVAYLPLGTDATVAYGEKDLKYTNDTKNPVFVEMTFRNRILTATLYGAKVPGRQVSLRPRVQKLGPGKINAQLYRVIKENGKIIRKDQLFTHQYRWDPTKKE